MSDEMTLPEGMTCGDCLYFQRCSDLGIVSAQELERSCDWIPSRFVLAKTVLAGTIHDLEACAERAERGRGEAFAALDRHRAQVEELRAILVAAGLDMAVGYDLPGAVREIVEQRKFAAASCEQLRESRRKMVEAPLAVLAISESWAPGDEWVAEAKAIVEDDQ